MTRDVIFRCDAGPGIGGGHMRRCVALASALATRGWRSNFAVARGLSQYASAATDAGFRVIELAERENEAADAYRQLGPAAMVVFDHYQRDAGDEARWRTEGTRLIAIDDVPVRTHMVDILVDPAGGFPVPRWLDVAPEASILSDIRYAIIRSDVLVCRGEASSIDRTRPVRRILISFGLSDRADAAAQSLNAIVSTAVSEDAQISVIVGPGRLTSELSRISKTNPDHVFVFVEPADYLSRVAHSDIVIGAGGVSALERACLGVPSIAIATADNQLGTMRQLSEAGATVDLGVLDASALDRLAPALRQLIDGGAERGRIAERATALVDGCGAERLAELLIDAMRRMEARQ
jgi:UDP-2,4-diacetamido-2,4,6-trideoxy-beta-L-altropyranose hydrolase